MRKRKNTGRLLSILLCLVMVLGMLPITAQAEEWGKVPGSSGTNTYEKADIEVEIPITKTVEQGGNIAPGEASFTFELLMRSNEDSEAKVLDTAEITTNGAGTTEHSLKFKVPGKLDGADGFSKNEIYLREKKGRAAGWTYSDALYRVNRNLQDDQTYTYSFNRVDGENAGNYLEATFTNTYTYYELPFTKTVKLGGNAAPGRERFELELVQTGVGSPEDYADVYTASVLTNGVGDYDGKLVISGPADQVEALVCEGFYVREKNAGGANWTYDDAVWFVTREEVSSGPGDGIIIDGPLPPSNVPSPDGGSDPGYTLVIYPTTAESGDNGIYYTPKGDSGGENDLHQHLYLPYQRHSHRRGHHGQQDRRSGQGPCRGHLRAGGQPGPGGLSGHLQHQRHCTLYGCFQRYLYSAGKESPGGLCALQ